MTAPEFRRAEKRSGKHTGVRGDFWSKVDKSAGPFQCWPWLAAKLVVGYGSVREPGTRRQIGAHRLAYTLTYGPIPAGHDVMHTCDQRDCCNPAHLVAGTRKVNMRDCVAKGRQQHGETHSQAKLTTATVLKIAERYADGEQLKEIATDLGVSLTTVADIIRGRTWKHLGVAS